MVSGYGLIKEQGEMPLFITEAIVPAFTGFLAAERTSQVRHAVAAFEERRPRLFMQRGHRSSRPPLDPSPPSASCRQHTCALMAPLELHRSRIQPQGRLVSRARLLHSSLFWLRAWSSQLAKHLPAGWRTIGQAHRRWQEKMGVDDRACDGEMAGRMACVGAHLYLLMQLHAVRPCIACKQPRHPPTRKGVSGLQHWRAAHYHRWFRAVAWAMIWIMKGLCH